MRFTSQDHFCFFSHDIQFSRDSSIQSTEKKSSEPDVYLDMAVNNHPVGRVDSISQDITQTILWVEEEVEKRSFLLDLLNIHAGNSTWIFLKK